MTNSKTKNKIKGWIFAAVGALVITFIAVVLGQAIQVAYDAAVTSGPFSNNVERHTEEPKQEKTEASATGAEALPYDRAWFESRKTNAATVVDDFGVACEKTIRYELMKVQSSEFVWEDDCSGIKTATVQDWYSGEWLTVSGNANEFETEHVVPFSLLFDAFGRYIQAEGNQEMGFALYYDADNMVAATKSLNAGKSDRIGSDVMETVCPVVSYDCSEWNSPYANNSDYTEMSLKMWSKWETLAQDKGWH